MSPEERFTEALKVVGRHDSAGWDALLGCSAGTSGRLARCEQPSEMILRHLEFLAGIRKVSEERAAVPEPVRPRRPEATKALGKLMAYSHLSEDEIVEGLLLEVALQSRAGFGVAPIAQRIKNALKAGRIV